MALTVTVGQLVVERPSRARIFEKFGIDYCCGGKIPLVEACQQKDIDVQKVLAALEEESTSPKTRERDWSTASLTELAAHIEATHHAYLRQELPRLDYLTGRVANAHGRRRPELLELREAFLAFKAELDLHMIKEERMLFPMCRELDSATSAPSFHCGSVQNPVAVMIHEHDNAGHSLERFRQLTDGYQAPPDACNTYRAMLASLSELESDMHQHVHKENNILFPRAIALEAKHNKCAEARA